MNFESQYVQTAATVKNLSILSIHFFIEKIFFFEQSFSENWVSDRETNTYKVINLFYRRLFQTGKYKGKIFQRNLQETRL
jgi:hypothetical protein